MRYSVFLRAFGVLASAAILGACSGDGSSAGTAGSTSSGLEQIPVVVDDDPLYEYHTDGGDQGTGGGGGDVQPPDSGLAPGTGHQGGTVNDNTGPQDDEAPAPEPATLALLGGGLAALAASRRKKNKQQD